MPASASARQAPGDDGTNCASPGQPAAPGRDCRSGHRARGPSAVGERAPRRERRERLAGVEDVAVAHVVGDVERRGEEERHRASGARRRGRTRPSGGRTSVRIASADAGHEAAQHEHRERVDGERPPVRDRRAQRIARARRPRAGPGRRRAPARTTSRRASAARRATANSIASLRAPSSNVALSVALHASRSSAVAGAGAVSVSSSLPPSTSAVDITATVMPATNTTPSDQQRAQVRAEALEQVAERAARRRAPASTRRRGSRPRTRA